MTSSEAFKALDDALEAAANQDTSAGLLMAIQAIDRMPEWAQLSSEDRWGLGTVLAGLLQEADALSRREG